MSCCGFEDKPGYIRFSSVGQRQGLEDGTTGMDSRTVHPMEIIVRYSALQLMSSIRLISCSWIAIRCTGASLAAWYSNE